MRVSVNDWIRYARLLGRISDTASALMQAYMDANGPEPDDGLIEYAYGLVTKYGEASGALACQYYDEVAEASGKRLPAAEAAATASYDETRKAIYGTVENRNNTVPSTVGRLVKQAGADTTLQNAKRDRAQFAWIPQGDETCAFCITLASRGWQYISKRTLKNGHAEHIHANCLCEYAISFDKDPQVGGYDPDYYKKIYDDAAGNTPREKINAIRREQYAEQKEQAEKISQVVDIPPFTPAKSIQEAEEFAKQFADNVSYKGLTLEQANEINDQLNTLTAKYETRNLESLRQYGRIKAVADANFREIRVNGKLIGDTSPDIFDLNQMYYKAQLKAFMDKYPSGNYPANVQKEVEKYQFLLRYKRWSVTKTYGTRGTITHEYGHVIADQYFGMINGGYATPNFGPEKREMADKLKAVYQKAKDTGDIWKLSKYAAQDKDEFFAEAFTALEFGEELPDYITDMVGEILNGSAM